MADTKPNGLTLPSAETILKRHFDAEEIDRPLREATEWFLVHSDNL